MVGGGQGGLSASYYLKLHNIEHVVLEKSDKPAFAWREQKWDSFCFVTPNWTINLPGGSYKDFKLDPDGFILRNELVNYFENYIKKHELPIKYNSQVKIIKQKNNGWEVETENIQYLTKNVIVATGFFQTPKIPDFGSNLKNDILQLHTSEYKNPDQLQDGEVLVVGTGQSGMQIAEEVYKSGKKVHMAVGTSGRVPRRYRGNDSVFWWDKIGNYTKDVNTLKSPKDRFGSNPSLTGIDGGHDLTFHQFYVDGVSLYGHMVNISQDGGTAHFADDLQKLIKHVDDFENNILNMVDDAIEKLDLEVTAPPTRNLDRQAFEQEIILELDLVKTNIRNVIWGTGYNRDYSFIKAEHPSVDDMGFPLQKKGVSPNIGLFFVGMPWITSPGSGLLYGVGKDAEYIVSYISKS